MHNKLAALFLCVCLCVSLSSCGSNPAEPGNTEAFSTEIQTVQGVEETTASESGTQAQGKPFGAFTMKELCEQNRVSVLLKNYKTVSYSQNNIKGKKIQEGCYFTYNGYPVSAESWVYNGKEYFYSFNGSRIDVVDGKYVMRVYSGPDEERILGDELPSDTDSDIEYDITTCFDTGISYIYDVKETADSYTFSIGESEDEKDYSDILCKVSKYDLSIREVILNYGTGSESVTVFRYNEPAKDYGFTEGWKDYKFREVTVIQELSVNGDIANGFFTVTAPYNVEVRPFAYSDYALWANGEWTKEYEYPGDNCDYTVYFTNTMG